jgi:hypothetical protein
MHRGADKHERVCGRIALGGEYRCERSEGDADDDADQRNRRGDDSGRAMERVAAKVAPHRERSGDWLVADLTNDTVMAVSVANRSRSRHGAGRENCEGCAYFYELGSDCAHV